MAIHVTLDAVLAKRGMTGKQLAEEVGLSETQMSMFRSGKVRGVRFATLAKMCRALDCQPGDLFRFTDEGDDG
jgi:putative transcriptional regulator